MPINEDIVTPIPGIENLTYEEANILLNILKLSMENAQWMRNYFHSALKNLPDGSAIGTRLFVKHQMDIYNGFSKNFNAEESQQFSNIIYKLIASNWQLANAYKDNDKSTIDLSNAQWHQNINEFVEFLVRVNKHMDETQLKTLLHNYIDLKNKEIIAFLNSNYNLEIKIYDEIVEKVIHIASYLAMGIIAKQRALNQNSIRDKSSSTNDCILIFHE